MEAPEPEPVCRASKANRGSGVGATDEPGPVAAGPPYADSASRTLRAMASIVNGLARNGTPASSGPQRAV